MSGEAVNVGVSRERWATVYVDGSVSQCLGASVEIGESDGRGIRNSGRVSDLGIQKKGMSRWHRVYSREGRAGRLGATGNEGESVAEGNRPCGRVWGCG